MPPCGSRAVGLGGLRSIDAPQPHRDDSAGGTIDGGGVPIGDLDHLSGEGLSRLDELPLSSRRGGEARGRVEKEQCSSDGGAVGAHNRKGVSRRCLRSPGRRGVP